MTRRNIERNYKRHKYSPDLSWDERNILAIHSNFSVKYMYYFVYDLVDKIITKFWQYENFTFEIKLAIDNSPYY